MILGLIPARGGSKGVPGKNIRVVNGKPLIAHAIQCGLKCPSIDHLIVSTDSDKIADIARRYGADVPFLRPAHLAEDTTPMLPVIQHAVAESERYFKEEIELIVLLDPTGPMRVPEDIETCVDIIRKKDCDAVISGNTAHRSPYFNMVSPVDGYVQLTIKPERNVGRRQDSPTVYDLNTVVWVYSRRAVMEDEKRIPTKTILYQVPSERAIDLDSELDFQFIEFIMNTKLLRRS